MIDLQKLAELETAATPGEWKWKQTDTWQEVVNDDDIIILDDGSYGK